MPYHQFNSVREAEAKRSSSHLPKISSKKQPPAHPLLGLQRSIGNRAIQRLIQSHSNGQKSLNLMTLQAKLIVGASDHQYEQEADRVAAKVMTMTTSVPSQTLRDTAINLDQEDSTSQSNTVGASITTLRQQPAKENQKEKLQFHTNGIETTDAEIDVQGVIKLGREKGCCLPDSVRKFMEPRFGVDFSEVRVHQGREAAKMSRALNAQAFTVGNNIFLGAGKAAGNTQLLAHELTHVVQQSRGGSSERPSRTSSSNFKEQYLDPPAFLKHTRQRPPSPISTAAGSLAKQPVRCSPAPTVTNCWALKARCYNYCSKAYLKRFPPDIVGYYRCVWGCCDWAFKTCKKKGYWPCIFPGM